MGWRGGSVSNALAEDLGSVPGTYMAPHNYLIPVLIPGDLVPLNALYAHGTLIYMKGKHSYIQK